MKFRTEITPAPSKVKLLHSKVVCLIGSCFADHIGKRLELSGFKIATQPCGIVYNPLSIAEQLNWVLTKETPPDHWIFEHLGLWRSWMHHSSFSRSDKKELIENIELKKAGFQNALLNASHLFITLGSSFAWQKLSTQNIVANCHKVPSAEFAKTLLPLGEMHEIWLDTIHHIRQINPKVQLVFTVSPVRHQRDGMIENSRSKARLIELCHELTALEGVEYFPAYELLVDDLRDYRFFEKDLLHPNELGQDYIWEKFQTSFFDDKTKDLSSKVSKLSKSLMHRSRNGAATHRDSLKPQFENLEMIHKLDLSHLKNTL